MPFFLPKDMRALGAKIDAVGEQIKKASLDGGDWTQQASETWHDNFGYEEAERQKYALATRLTELQHLQRTAQTPPIPDGSEAAIGTVVTLHHRHHATGATVPRTITIGSHMVLDKRRDDEISCASPVAMALLGAMVGDTVTYSAGGTRHTATVESITVAETLWD